MNSTAQIAAVRYGDLRRRMQIEEVSSITAPSVTVLPVAIPVV
ncbi:hypothetical protein ABH922_000210 [Rhodococcus sp. 27YEA15]